MMNFWRVVRMALRYRIRYGLAVFFAVGGAFIFGGNIAAALPLLKVLFNDQTIHGYLDQRIGDQKATIQRLEGKRASIDSPQPESPIDSSDEAVRAPTGDTERKSLDIAIKRASQQLWLYEEVKPWVDKFVPSDRFQTLVLILFVLVTGMLVTFVCEFANEVLVASVTEHTMLTLRNQFFRQVMRMEMSGFTQQGTSELMARFTSDMKALSMGIEVILGKFIREPLKSVVCLGVACWLNWRLTLVTLILVPLALLAMSLIGHMMKRAARRSLETMASIYQLLQESFQGIKIVKAFTMEVYERLRFYRETRNYYRKAMRIARLEAITGPVMGMIAVSAVLAAVLAGSYLVIRQKAHILGIRMSDGVMETDSMLMLFAFLFMASDPVRKVSGVYARVQKAAPAADRIFAFVDNWRHRFATPRGASRLPRHEKSIEFESVCFRYMDEKPVLRDVSLKVAFGQTIALVGPNGCGKSTLVNLLPRFYDPQQGRVLIDGLDIRDVRRRSLRRQFGVVTQETILFNDTVFNNIAYGNRRATTEQVTAAAKQAYAHRFIEELPQGYQTIVGEKAVKLSGGQRQRIALARAILRDPAVLILDEATSALDIESESLIQKVLNDFIRNRTTFLITHRLASLQLADQIIVMEDGKIADHGTHTDLLKRCPLYGRLHEIHAHSVYRDAG
jgi:ABC-type multidrug transport system fused ATPase/permease subunit